MFRGESVDPGSEWGSPVWLGQVHSSVEEPLHPERGPPVRVVLLLSTRQPVRVIFRSSCHSLLPTLGGSRGEGESDTRESESRTLTVVCIEEPKDRRGVSRTSPGSTTKVRWQPYRGKGSGRTRDRLCHPREVGKSRTTRGGPYFSWLER